MMNLRATAPAKQCQRRAIASGTRPVPRWVASVSVRRPAETWPQRAPEALANSQSKPRLRLLSSISRLCEIQGLTSKYEVLAGRGAMMGVSTALLVELLNPGSSVLSQLSANDLTMALSTVAVAALGAGLLGSQGTGGADARAPALLESVISSLTAVQRSASSVTGAKENNVDRVVDEVVRSTFTQERIRELTDFQLDLTFEEDLDLDLY